MHLRAIALTASLTFFASFTVEASLVLTISENPDGNARFEFAGTGESSQSRGFKAHYVPVGTNGPVDQAFAYPFLVLEDNQPSSLAAVSLGVTFDQGYLLVYAPWVKNLDGGESISILGAADTEISFSEFSPGTYAYGHRSGLDFGETITVIVADGGPTAIPEPSTIAMAGLLLIGTAGAGFTRRRKAKKSTD